MSKKKSKKVPEETKVEAVQEEQPQDEQQPQEEQQPEDQDQPKEVASSPASEEPEPDQHEEPLTLERVYQELTNLAQLVAEHAEALAALQSKPTRKRRPAPNGKVQILDKQTGEVYPSKNSAYKTLLKAGELKELVDQGIFGPDPEKNTFGWYALVRAWPDRFEERKEEEAAAV